MRNIMYALYRKPESKYHEHIFRWYRDANRKRIEYRNYYWGKNTIVKRVVVNVCGEICDIYSHTRKTVTRSIDDILGEMGKEEENYYNNL